ncbi:MAG: hypothetical protein WCE40_02960 [Polyangia bacterium]
MKRLRRLSAALPFSGGSQTDACLPILPFYYLRPAHGAVLSRAALNL